MKPHPPVRVLTCGAVAIIGGVVVAGYVGQLFLYMAAPYWVYGKARTESEQIEVIKVERRAIVFSTGDRIDDHQVSKLYLLWAVVSGCVCLLVMCLLWALMCSSPAD